MGKFYSTKTYNNDRGLSCAFRQWRAEHSHCKLIHGYSLGFKVIFECDELDERNWVMDFGGLKKFKNWLEDMFDHTLVIAEDDPQRGALEELNAKVVTGIDFNLYDGSVAFGVLNNNEKEYIEKYNNQNDYENLKSSYENLGLLNSNKFELLKKVFNLLNKD